EVRYKEFGELIQPFKDSKRVSQLVRKLLKTTGLNCSSFKETTLPSSHRLNDDYWDELKETNGEKDLEAHCTNAKPLGKALPRKEKDPRSFTLPCFINNVTPPKWVAAE
ncbi:hypothetical protein Tco_1231059, partial [Tanacetum coccineum]